MEAEGERKVEASEATAFSYISSVMADWAIIDFGRVCLGPPRGATGGGTLILETPIWTGGCLPVGEAGEVGEVDSWGGLEDGFSPLLSTLTLLLRAFEAVVTGIAYIGIQPSLMPSWFDWFEEEVPPEAGGLFSFFALRPRLGAVVGEGAECSSTLTGFPAGRPFSFASGSLLFREDTGDVSFTT